jgi:hypothetical protein
VSREKHSDRVHKRGRSRSVGSWLCQLGLPSVCNMGWSPMTTKVDVLFRFRGTLWTAMTEQDVLLHRSCRQDPRPVLDLPNA